MGWREERLRELQEQRADLERLRDSGLGDKDALRVRLDEIDDDIEHQEREIELKAEEQREAAERDGEDRADSGPEPPDAHDRGPLDVERIHNFETFPEVPDHEPAEPVEEPINAWELQSPSPSAADGGDALRPDSVIPDLGRRASKAPLSDEAEAAIEGAGGAYRPRPLHFVLAGAAIIPALVVFNALVTAPNVAGSAAPVAGAASAAPRTAPVASTPNLAGPAARSAAAAGYDCVGNQKALVDTSNGFAVSNGAAGGPKVSTGGQTYCLVSMRTYHWNNGRGAEPGSIGLIGGTGNVGPMQARGTSGQGGAQNVNWMYVPDPPDKQLLQGDYVCYDSDPATWAQNDQSGHLGFCAVFVQDAVKK